MHGLVLCTGLGDSTGYITAPVTGAGTFTYMLDSAVKGKLAIEDL